MPAQLKVDRTPETFKNLHAAWCGSSASWVSMMRLLSLTLCFILNGCQQAPSTRVSPDRREVAASQPDRAQPPVVQPEAQVYEDEALLKDRQAIIGGRVQNISGTALQELSVEVELTSRRDGTTETRNLPVTPASLRPQEEGRYSIAVRSHDWSRARLLKLKSGARQPEEVSYKSQVGAKRPPERVPQGRTTVVVAPRPRNSGEEFLNTPETAISVP